MRTSASHSVVLEYAAEGITTISAGILHIVTIALLTGHVVPFNMQVLLLIWLGVAVTLRTLSILPGCDWKISAVLCWSWAPLALACLAVLWQQWLFAVAALAQSLVVLGTLNLPDNRKPDNGSYPPPPW